VRRTLAAEVAQRASCGSGSPARPSGGFGANGVANCESGHLPLVAEIQGCGVAAHREFISHGKA